MAVSIGLSDLEFGRERLGSGGTGTVYKGRWRSRNMTVAIKTLTQEVSANELEIMQLVSHPNLIQFYGVVVVLQPPTYCIVTEYAEGGSLSSFLHQNDFDPGRDLNWARQIAAGMKYLHFDVLDRVVIHGDLKSNNILIGANSTAKICDFGSAKVREQLPGMSVLTNTKIFGTPRWMAPETMENKPISKQCDVYSYGIVVWELLTHKIPFEDISDPFQIYKMVVMDKKRPPLPATCAPVLANLLEKCWDPDPHSRPEFTEILSTMEHLPQMLVDKGSAEQLATQEPDQLHVQGAPQIARSQFLQVVEKPRPVPRPRSPRPTPQRRSLQPDAEDREPTPLETSSLSLSSGSTQLQPAFKVSPTPFPRKSRSAHGKGARVISPVPRKRSETFKVEIVPAETGNSESDRHKAHGRADFESSGRYDDPHDPRELSQPNWVVSRDEVELLDDELGKGAWGVVRKARFRGDIVAAKCLHKVLQGEPNLLQAFRREMDIAANLRHPNLVLFLGATTEGELIILSELMDSNLRAVLDQVRLSRFQIKSISFDVTRALNYLHSMKPHPVIHRDVTSANVLLERFGPDNWRAKVSDYGSLRAINVARTVAPGNPVYAAPEAMRLGLQSCKMDTYGFGILLIEMCSSVLPTPHQRTKLLQEIQWPEMQTLIGKCLQANPEDRPTMLDIISALEQLPQLTPVKMHAGNGKWKMPENNGVQEIENGNMVSVLRKWFSPSMSRTEAIAMLESEGKEGNFVVRLSGTAGTVYSLSVYHRGQVFHYRIKHNRNEYYIEDDFRFQTVEEMIEFYKKSKGGLFTKLREYLPASATTEQLSHPAALTDPAWEIPQSEIKLGSEIARGHCGCMVTGRWKGYGVAVRVTRQEAVDEAGLQFIGDAVNTLKKFQHENLVKLVGLSTQEWPLLIVTELTTQGPLDKYLQQNQSLLEKKAVCIDMATQICSAMKFLEENQIVHGDLAARNCLVGERNVVKVADCSLALYTSPRKPSRTVVSFKWAAPELFTHLPVFTTKSDIWSFGILLWEIWSGGQTPYHDLQNEPLKDQLKAGYRLEKPGNCPADVYRLMYMCWEEKSEQRPTFVSLHEELEAVLKRAFGLYDRKIPKQQSMKLARYAVKLCVLGNNSVGKTCVVNKFVANVFSGSVGVTVGVAITTKTIRVSDNLISFQIWDTAKQERYTEAFYNGSAAALIVYDITSERSFKEMQALTSKLKQSGPQNMVLAIAGNKADLEHAREVPRSIGNSFANNYNAIFLETSAKDGTNVHELFKAIAEHLPLDEVTMTDCKPSQWWLH